MRYWRMQLHPNDSENATEHTIKSLSNSLIGLDFYNDIGDLEKLGNEELERSPNNIEAFLNGISFNDRIVIFLHNKPFALITGVRDYNYIKKIVPELSVWFRHFRKVEKISYYSDYFGKMREEHGKIVMTNTFSEASIDSATGQLISEWESVFES